MLGKAYRMAGLCALCLAVGVVLSGVVGAQPQPAPIVTVDLIAMPTEGPAPLTVVFSAMGQPRATAAVHRLLIASISVMAPVGRV